jgi:hypothetical protein
MAGGLMARFSRVRDGQITNPQGRTGPEAYVAKTGDQFYVRDISVDDEKVEFKLLTVDPIESTSKGTTRAQRYYAMVQQPVPNNSTCSLSHVAEPA